MTIKRYKPIERLQEDFSKKVFIGSAAKSTIYLDISVKMKEKAIDWETLQPVENRDVVSISGNIGKHSAGQINDTLMELYNQGKLSLSIDEDDFLTLMKIWDKYHLNDLIPGTKEQMAKIKELHNAGFDTSANNYSNVVKVVPKTGDYTYGSRWLSREVPKYIVDFLMKL